MSTSPGFSSIIRLLNAEGAEAYRDLRLEGLREAPTAFASSFEEECDFTPAQWAQRLGDGDRVAVYGAWEGGALLGVAGYSGSTRLKERHKASLWGVYVRPAGRGRGLAGRLVENVIAHAAARGTVLRAVVTAENLAALGVYLRLGFRAYGTEPQALVVDGVARDDVLLALDPACTQGGQTAQA